MQASDTYRQYEIRVQSARNTRGAWVAEIQFFRDNVRVDLPVPETVSPEWLTEEEALRGGLEEGWRILKTHDR
nr:DUF6566 family protein [Burkholderia alba]